MTINSNFSTQIIDLVHEFFPINEHYQVFELLEKYKLDHIEIYKNSSSKSPSDRLLRDILQLSKGNVKSLPRLIQLALTDWRDLIVAAEYELKDGRYISKQNDSEL